MMLLVLIAVFRIRRGYSGFLMTRFVMSVFWGAGLVWWVALMFYIHVEVDALGLLTLDPIPF
jgi:hypothetical protein